MEKYILFGITLIFCTVGTITAQFITANDVLVNETWIKTAVRNLTEGSTQFSLNLLRTLNDDKKASIDSSGIFFSPYSIWSALILTYLGSQGATELEFKNVLGMGDTDKVTTWEAYRNIRNRNDFQRTGRAQQLFDEPNHVSYNTANRLYFQEGAIFNDCLRKMLDREIDFVDFKNSPTESRDKINRWIEKETHQRIKDMIPSDGITSMTRMVIANAVYFKEAWKLEFEPEGTQRHEFTLQTGKQIFVSMMSTTGRFLYGKSEELHCHALELPYAGNMLSMTILLPQNRYNGVDILAQNLTPQRLNNLLNNMYKRNLVVMIPKFKIEDRFELSSVLTKMGLNTVFNSSLADLSGFTGRSEFVVDSVTHKAFIDVNEEGTEAAAATVLVLPSSFSYYIPSFIADYPFIFFIRDNLADVILFLGTVQKPPEFGTV